MKIMKNLTEVISPEELMREIINLIEDGDRMKELMKNYQLGDSKEFISGFIAGLSWAGLLTSNVTHYFAKTINNETEGEGDN